MKEKQPPLTYQIKLKGHLSPMLQAEFAGFEIMPQENGETLLVGSIIDQAALHAVLRRIRDLGLPLLAINQIVSKEN